MANHDEETGISAEEIAFFEAEMGEKRPPLDFTNKLLAKVGLPPLSPSEMEEALANHISVWDIPSLRGDEPKLLDWIRQTVDTIHAVHFTTEVPNENYRQMMIGKLLQDKPVDIRRIVYRRPGEEHEGIYAWLEDFRDENGNLLPHYSEFEFNGIPLDHDFIIFDLKRVVRFRPDNHPELPLYNDLRLIEDEREARFHLSIFNHLLMNSMPAADSVLSLKKSEDVGLPDLETEMSHASSVFASALPDEERVENFKYAKRYFEEAEYYFMNSSDQSYEKSAELYKKVVEKLEFPLAYLHQGQCYVQLGKLKDAEQSFREGAESAVDLDYYAYRPLFQENLGRVLYHRGMMRKALVPLDRAHALFVQQGDYERAAYALMYLGRASCHLGNYKRAFEKHQAALKIFLSSNNLYGQAQVINAIGRIHGERSQHKKSMECFARALEIFQRFGNQLRIAQTLNNIAQDYLYQEHYASALEFCENAIAIFKELNNYPGLARAYNNRGRIYTEQERYADALNDFSEAYKYSEDLGDELQTAFIMNNVGRVYAEEAARSSKVNDNQRTEELFEKSHFLLKKVYELFDFLGSSSGKSRNLKYIGKLYRLRGDIRTEALCQYKSEFVRRYDSFPDDEEVDTYLQITQDMP